MAALTIPDAVRRTNSPLLAGIMMSIATTDEMANVIPMVMINTSEWKYTREGTLPSTTFIGDDGASTENSAGQDDAVNVPVRRIVGNVDVDNLARDLEGESFQSHIPDQIMKKAKATWRLIKSTMVTGGNVTSFTWGAGTLASLTAGITAIDAGPWLSSDRFGNGTVKYTHAGTLWQFRAPGDRDFGEAVAAVGDGDFTLYSWNKSRYITATIDVSGAVANAEGSIYFASNTNEFDGMNEVLDPAQLLASTGTDGDAFSLGTLDKLISLEKIKTNRGFIMNSSLVQKFYAAYRALGGTDPDHVVLEGYNTSRVPTYRGIPLLENDNIPSTEAKGTATTLSSIYLASLDADQGLCLGAANAGGQELDVEGDPRSTTVAGFRITDIGELEDADHTRTRVKWYGALGLKSKLALARASEVITA